MPGTRTSDQRVAVVGLGAIGGLLASEAAGAGHRVTVCVREPVPGLVLRLSGQENPVPVEVATDPRQVPPVDWLLLATKAQHTGKAAHWLRALGGPDTVTVVAQNGIEQRGMAGEFVPPETVLPALAYVSAERLAPGRVAVHRPGTLAVPEGPAGARLAGLLSGELLTVRPVPDFHTESWRKLLSNVVVNPITALTLRRADVLREPEIGALATELITEAMRVGVAEGARLSPDEIAGMVDRFSTFPAAGGSSMLYDRLAGRDLEHEHLTGAVVRAAERHGIDVPLHRALLALLRAVDRGAR